MISRFPEIEPSRVYDAGFWETETYCSIRPWYEMVFSLALSQASEAGFVQPDDPVIDIPIERGSRELARRLSRAIQGRLQRALQSAASAATTDLAPSVAAVFQEPNWVLGTARLEAARACARATLLMKGLTHTPDPETVTDASDREGAMGGG